VGAKVGNFVAEMTGDGKGFNTGGLDTGRTDGFVAVVGVPTINASWASSDGVAVGLNVGNIVEGVGFATVDKEGVAVGEKVGISVGLAVTGDLEGSKLVDSSNGFDVGDAVTG